MIVLPDGNQTYVRPHWTIGNTTVRNPLRMPPAVEALAKCKFLIGTGRDNEEAFAFWLNDQNIVALRETTEDVTSLGRKWRGALEKMGFILPEGHREPFRISPMGHRLINARTDVELQMVLRYSVASYRCKLAYPDDVRYIHPLSWTIEVLRKVEDLLGSGSGQGSGVSTEEFALFIQSPPPSLSASEAASDILSFRRERSASSNPNAYSKNFIKERKRAREVSGAVVKGAVSSLLDFADANIRYLTMSGLLSLKGIASQRRAGIRLSSEHLAAAEAVADAFSAITDSAGYFESHWNPSDIVIGDLNSLLRQLKQARVRAQGLGLQVSSDECEDRDSIQSHVLATESAILDEIERRFSVEQRARSAEISQGLKEILLPAKSRSYTVVDPDLKPSYLEWLLWRSCLALADGEVDSALARGFRVDDDLRPIGFAPPGRADLIFEFESFVLVVEATLMAGSRQEAAEGEPVRRHVADIVDASDKPVYCLFVASSVDLNTFETFRLGRWYNSSEKLLSLDILPLNISQFLGWFNKAMDGGEGVEAVVSLVEKCRSLPSALEDSIAWRKDLSLVLG